PSPDARAAALPGPGTPGGARRAGDRPARPAAARWDRRTARARRRHGRGRAPRRGAPHAAAAAGGALARARPRDAGGQHRGAGQAPPRGLTRDTLAATRMLDRPITRRRLIGAAGAGALLAGVPVDALARRRHRHADVVVVGAGFAGLTAARELVRHGR